MNDWMTEKEAAGFLGCSRSFLANQRYLARRPDPNERCPSLRFAKDLGIPFTMLGRHVRYSLADLDVWMRGSL